jgi:hypothetical protein
MHATPLHSSASGTDQPQFTHIAFADESNYNQGRYRGLGVVSLRYTDLPSVEDEIRRILSESNVSEFKWKALGGAKERFAAEKLLSFTLEKVEAGILRVDVVTWDIEDSRHKIRGRDDLANLQRMYHHLLKNVMRERWPKDSTWLLCPDEHTAMPWADIAEFLKKASHKIHDTPNLFEPQCWVDIHRVFNLADLRPSDSKQTPLIQLADLLTGLCVYSRNEYSIYEQWLELNQDQMSLFAPPLEELKLSRTHKDRCPLLRDFYERCQRKLLGVSLKKSRGLKTFNPKNPMNFWWYIPQHEMDKAPMRIKKEKR